MLEGELAFWRERLGAAPPSLALPADRPQRSGRGLALPWAVPAELAGDLRELVDFYDRRFNIRFTEQEKVDLVNFLGVL